MGIRRALLALVVASAATIGVVVDTAPASADLSNCSIETVRGPARFGTFKPGNEQTGASARRPEFRQTRPPTQASHYGTSLDIEGIEGRWKKSALGPGGIAIVRGRQFHLAFEFESIGTTDHVFNYGVASDIPVAGDWDADDDESIALLRAAPGGYLWLENNELAGGAADRTVRIVGPSGAKPLAGDWNGDGFDEPGLFDSETSRFYLYDRSGQLIRLFRFGRPGDEGMVGDFDDDGDDTVAIKRGTTFAYRNTNTGGPADHTGTDLNSADRLGLVFDGDNNRLVCT